MTCSVSRTSESFSLSGRFDSSILLGVKPPTGEPYAGNPPVRFGGRGSCGSPYPYPHCTPPSIPPAKPTFLKKEKTMSQRITKIALLALVILVPCLGAVAQGKSGTGDVDIP